MFVNSQILIIPDVPMKKYPRPDFSIDRNLLVVFILGAIWCWVNPVKAQTNNITTTIGQYQSSAASTCVGDTISIPVSINMATGIGISAFSFAINYDTTRLQCVSIPSGIHPAIESAFLSNCGFFTNLGSNGAQSGRQFRVAWFDLNPVSFSGVMFQLRFRVLSSGYSAVTWDLNTPGNCEYADVNADIIPNCQFINGSISCGSNCTRPPATLQVNGPTIFCSGSNVVLQANTGSGLSYLWKKNGLILSGVTTSSYTATESGSYSVIVRTSSNCASTQAAPVLVEAIERPAALISAVGSPSLCGGQTVTLQANTGTDLSYQWLLNGNPIAGAVSSAYTTGTTGVYTVNVSRSRGSIACGRISNSITVTQNPSINAQINPSGNIIVCGNETVTLQATTGNGYAYAWLRNGLPIQGATGSSFQPQMPGSYQILISQGGCSAVSAATVVELKPRLFMPATLACINDTVEIPVCGSRFDSVAAISLALNYNPQTMTYVGYTALHPLLAGSAQIGTNGNQIRMAWASLNTLNSTVQDTLLRFRFVVQQPGQLAWNTGTVGDCELAGPDGQLLSYCFENTTTAIIDTVQILSSTQGPVDIFESDTASLTVNALHANSYQWQYRATGSSSWNNIQNSAEWSGAQSSSLTIFNATYQRPHRIYRLALSNGCQNWYSSEILVRVKQRVSLSLGSTTSCAGDTVRMPILVTGGREINAVSMVINLPAGSAQWLSWNPSPSVPNPGQWISNLSGNQLRLVWNSLNSASFPNGAALGELVFVAQAGGSITWNTSNPGDCELADADGQVVPTQFIHGSILANPLPSNQITVSNSMICPAGNGGTATLSADPGAGNQYQWYLNGQIITGAQGAQYTTSVPGTYSAFITTALGCGRWTQSQSIAYYCASNPTLTVLGNSTSCDTAVALLANTSCGPQQIAWLKDGITLPGIIGNQYAATSTGTYSIQATDLSSGCVQSSPGVFISIHPLPVAQIVAASSTSICLGDSVELLGTPSTGIQYQWIFNGNPLSGPQSQNLWARIAGNYSLMTTNTAGCTNLSSSITVITRNCNEISGNVTYHNPVNTPLPQSKVYLFQSNTGSSGPWILSDSTLSGPGGAYRFEQYPNGNFRVKAIPALPWNGVNGTDALFILRHNTGLGFTLSGLNLEAADVNANQLVNAGDVLTINRRFSNLLSSFPSGDWASEVQGFTANGQPVIRNIRTLCYGDVNGSYNFSSARLSSRLRLDAQGELSSNTSVWTWPVAAVDRQELGAISLVLGLPEGLKVHKVVSKMPVGSMEYGMAGQELRIVWHALEGYTPDPGQVLFELDMESPLSASVDWNPGQLEIKDLSELADVWANPIELGRLSMPRYVKSESNQDELRIVPNPSSGAAQVRLNLDLHSQHINVIVRDALGRMVYSALLDEAPVGWKSLDLPSSHWSKGAYSVQVSYFKNGQSCLLNQFLHRIN